ncbi:aspartate 1-decarboxylase [Helicobacter pylori]|uniref:aspartate 1-decarboxylase n=1 Tax=Helicobacter pylori TaxID=210 RepID=UPI0006810745|nr:aspartate 1-decarboxylase [Helicobacter pylori]KNE10185.1 L-aspartate 1-decarboxylase [Helicobacter pylori]
MTFEMLYSKIHRATITDANINYVGSITIDEDLAKFAKLREGMKVEVVDVNNGERFRTYVIFGKKRGEICINGAAARKVAIGDVVIILAYASMNEDEINAYKPCIVLVDGKNEILEK